MIWLVVWNPNCYSLHHFYIFFQRGRAQPPTSDDFSILFRIFWIFFGPTLWKPTKTPPGATGPTNDQVSSPRAVEKTVRAQAIFPVGWWPLFWDPKSGRTCCCPTCSKVISYKLYIYKSYFCSFLSCNCFKILFRNQGIEPTQVVTISIGFSTTSNLLLG